MKFPVELSVLFLFANVATAAPQPTRSEGQLTAAEKWVTNQVGEQGFADLRKKYPDEKNRRLSAHFLEQLLSGTLPGFTAHRMGVRIIGAVFDDEVNLSNAQIP